MRSGPIPPSEWLVGPTGDPDGVLAALIWTHVEPAVAGDDLEVRLLEQVPPFVRRTPGEVHAGLTALPAHGEREDAPSEIPVGPLPDPRLALEPAAVRLLDVLAARGEDVEDETPAGHEEAAHGSKGLEPFCVGLDVEESAERTGDERNALGHRWAPQIAQAEVEAVGDACLLRSCATDVEHRLGIVHADHPYSSLCDRHSDSAGPDAELDDRPASLSRFRDIEADVFSDASAPGVVEGRDGVIRTHEGR
jgi:hypothetical protein